MTANLVQKGKPNKDRIICIRSQVFVPENLPKFPQYQEKSPCTAQKMKFSIKDFFSKCDQTARKLRIQSNLIKKSLMENFIFCAVLLPVTTQPLRSHPEERLFRKFRILCNYRKYVCYTQSTLDQEKVNLQDIIEKIISKTHHKNTTKNC